MPNRLSTSDDLEVRDTPAAIEIVRGGTIAAHAGIRTEPDGVYVEMHTEAGHLPMTVRPALLRAVFRRGEIVAGQKVVITIPLGDSDLLRGIERHCTVNSVNGAGASCLIRAHVDAAREC
jgi:hypothetical protein